MASLLEIRKQITSVKNTRKITKAMQLVAASKRRKFQNRALASRAYVEELLAILANNLGSDMNSLYTQQRNEGSKLFVIYTSDKGLCGALNNKLLKALFRSKAWKETPKNERLLITIGRKSHEFAKNNGIEVAKHFTGVSEQLSSLEAVEVIDGILEFWRENKCKEVVFVAPHYQNSFTFYPVRKQFLPFSKEMLASHVGKNDQSEATVKTRSSDFMLFEPGQETATLRLHELIVEGLFLQAFLELKAAEYSSRMIAMKNATDAADKMIDDLTLTFNKARQEAITQQIAELAGASAAFE